MQARSVARSGGACAPGGIRRIASRFACSALLGAALAGCKSAPPPAPKPLDVQVSIVASAGLNPDRTGRPSPVLLHIYQLRDAGKFLDGQFDEVATRSESTLAGALLGRRDLIVRPGTTTRLDLQIDHDARRLGVVAEYSDLAYSRWRAASPAAPGGLTTLLEHHDVVIRLGARAVAIETPAAARVKRN